MPRTATVVAQSALETLRVSKDGFFHLVIQFPRSASALASKLHHTTQVLTAARARLNELGRGNDGGGAPQDDDPGALAVAKRGGGLGLTLGEFDRMQSTALDVLQRLIEATYTKPRQKTC